MEDQFYSWATIGANIATNRGFRGPRSKDPAELVSKDNRDTALLAAAARAAAQLTRSNTWRGGMSPLDMFTRQSARAHDIVVERYINISMYQVAPHLMESAPMPKVLVRAMDYHFYDTAVSNAIEGRCRGAMPTWRPWCLTTVVGFRGAQHPGIRRAWIRWRKDTKNMKARAKRAARRTEVA